MSANSEEPMPASNLEQGGKDSIVLLHSSASCGTQWRGFKETYRGRYDIVTPDLQGYGDLSTWSGSNAWTLDDEVLLVEAEVAHLPGHFHLVGHSFGGAVALKFAMNVSTLRALRRHFPSCFAPPSFHTRRPLLRYDRVYCSRHFDLRDGEVIATALTRRASDHLPVTCDLEPRDWTAAGTAVAQSPSELAS